MFLSTMANDVYFPIVNQMSKNIVNAAHDVNNEKERHLYNRENSFLLSDIQLIPVFV